MRKDSQLTLLISPSPDVMNERRYAIDVAIGDKGGKNGGTNKEVSVLC